MGSENASEGTRMSTEQFFIYSSFTETSHDIFYIDQEQYLIINWKYFFC